MYKHSDIFSLFNDEAVGWIDDDSSIMLKVITGHNNPVELSAKEAREIAKKLIEMADKLDAELLKN